jgi:CHRD domain-containing protein
VGEWLASTRKEADVRKLAPLGGIAVLALVMTAVALAAPKGMGWSAKLNAMQEVPKQAVKAPNGKGVFHGTLNGSTLTWTLSFSGLSGAATAAHIHIGAMGKAGNVVVPLCAPCKQMTHGTAKLSKAVMKDASKHLLYVNVHTAKNPAGEIRGQVAP